MFFYITLTWGFPGSSGGSESGRSPEEGNGKSLLYSCLRNPMDRGAWRARIHGITEVRHNLATKPLQQSIRKRSNMESDLFFPITLTWIQAAWISSLLKMLIPCWSKVHLDLFATYPLKKG